MSCDDIQVDDTGALVPWKVEAGRPLIYRILKTNSPVSLAGVEFVGQVRSERAPTADLLAELVADDASASSGLVLLNGDAVDAETTGWFEVWKDGQPFIQGPFASVFGSMAE